MRTLSLFYEQWLGKLPLGELERVSLLFDIGEIHRDSYGRLKRLSTSCSAWWACLALLVLIPFVVVGNLVGNRGPLFFRSNGSARTARSSTILKFRTMRRRRPERRPTGRRTTTRASPAFGRFLRRPTSTSSRR